MDDGFLIRQTLSGKRNAFRMLVVRYQRPLFRFLGGFGLGQAIAEELAQETFLRAYRNLSGYDAGKAKFSSWLFTIAKNLALNERARSHQRQPHADVAADEAESLARDSVPSAHEALETGELRLRVQRALQRLPEILRSTLVLAYLKELSMDEIASIESCSVGAVKSRIFRGKQLLRAELVESEDRNGRV
ncbi:MAG TPA: sigma-70 family RNA polymerase sigma factor [Polyangia bacterium]